MAVTLKRIRENIALAERNLSLALTSAQALLLDVERDMKPPKPKKETPRRVEAIPFEPEKWDEAQREIHTPIDLDEALHKAGCLTGWYRRPITIYCQVVDREEIYHLQPHEHPVPDGFHPVYRIESMSQS